MTNREKIAGLRFEADDLFGDAAYFRRDADHSEQLGECRAREADDLARKLRDRLDEPWDPVNDLAPERWDEREQAWNDSVRRHNEGRTAVIAKGEEHAHPV